MGVSLTVPWQSGPAGPHDRDAPNFAQKKRAAGSFAVASASSYLLAVAAATKQTSEIHQLWHVLGCSGSGKPDADWSSPLLPLLTAPRDGVAPFWRLRVLSSSIHPHQSSPREFSRDARWRQPSVRFVVKSRRRGS